ncbi:histidine kinase [Draconibacterium sp. IB214405]|uniref:sensor histidine kinase n=1 Tax=Draconibacterium sp. IB214405 TaxID=3097352 RepID=UPI002A182967|nr:histidine kinase [Draconibacterium sp. IB214405]MDX8341488.1 histidine kinase [Draconibacterium sp. IB214405]
MKCLDVHSKKKPDLVTRLPGYEPISIFGRFVVISIIAVFILHFIAYVTKVPADSDVKIPFIIYLVVILAFNAAAELQIILDNILERFLPVPKKVKLRLFLQVAVGIIFLYVAHRGIMYFVEPKLTLADSRAGVIMGMVTGLVFVQMVANSLTIARFTQKWLDSQEQIAEMKREKLRMDYNSLQDQLNPHFLFNNLSVLKSLIIYDQEVAVEFTENFTDVYRYVLQSKDKRLVKLNDELDFMKAYIALHKERLGEGIHVETNVSGDNKDREIAPLTGQLLIENAIKHNITSREEPLEIQVYIEEDCLVVANSLNRRAASYSTKTGLKNLVKRYEILTEKEIVVQYDEKRFEVKVPLL